MITYPENELSEALGRKLLKKEKTLLEAHLDYLIEANLQINLTAIHDKQEAWILHILDSLLGYQAFTAAFLNTTDKQFCDLGSGAGFPGIPLAICSGQKGILVDSVQKKAAFLKKTISQLELCAQLSASAVRAERIARAQKEQFWVVTARAVSSLLALLELASPLLCIGGRLIAYKGPQGLTELNQAKPALVQLGFCLEAVHEYQLPLNKGKRLLFVFLKTKTAQLALPRREGQAQRQPLFT